MSDLTDMISGIRESMSKINNTIAESHQSINDSYALLQEPFADPDSLHILEQLQLDSAERIKSLDTLTHVLISQVRALERSATAAEDQALQLHGLLDNAKEQVSLAKKEAVESEKQARQSRIHAILSLIFAGFSAFAAFVYPLISQFLLSP